MSAGNIERVQEYFQRQYELEEGSAEENIRVLFAEDAIIQTEDGKTVALEDIIRSATTLRQIPESECVMEVSDLKEEGDTVTFHSFLRFRSPETDEVNELDTDASWRFDEQGKVIESKSGASIVSELR
jgi:hypothetical protein